MIFRFRRFSHRLLALLLGLFFAVLAVSYWIVSRNNLAYAREQAQLNLERAAHIANNTVRERLNFLALSASVMGTDDAIKQVLRTGDNRTLATALQSYAGRVGASLIALYDTDGQFLTDSRNKPENENTGPFRYLIRKAIDKDMPENSGLSYLKDNNGVDQLHALIVVPLYAPYPNIFGWFGLAYPLDRDIRVVRDTSAVELTYLSVESIAKPRVLITTLPEVSLPAVQNYAAAVKHDRDTHRERPVNDIIDLSDDRYVTMAKFQELLGEDPILLVLQRPLSPELKSARETENTLVVTSLVALAAATLLVLFISRGVSEPVRQLAAHTEKIAAGDYKTRLALDRVDEIGQLAEAMNQMSTGLDERDRVRDLLDKNVSPEVAAQLLRDGAALGGQEREVTILFADLRGFTTLSEKLTPPELLVLLNRYFTRMSGPIEQNGGVIDKFIGDSIMALFGAPIAHTDSADRAVSAGLAMQAALVELNRELAAEGIAPLGIGIGINTGNVVAGQMGSQRRLNYSVIGDGVNVASRLQTLTRTAEYRTNLVVSAATVAALRRPEIFRTRALGKVPVKGRAEPVEIFAVE